MTPRRSVPQKHTSVRLKYCEWLTEKLRVYARGADVPLLALWQGLRDGKLRVTLQTETEFALKRFPS